MGRRKVVEITCDRCKRTETQNESEVSAEGGVELRLGWGGETTEYQDLCRRCRETVRNYVQRLRLVSEDKPESEDGKNPTGVKKGLFATMAK